MGCRPAAAQQTWAKRRTNLSAMSDTAASPRPARICVSSWSGVPGGATYRNGYVSRLKRRKPIGCGVRMIISIILPQRADDSPD
jgi:hypothetical protein